MLSLHAHLPLLKNIFRSNRLWLFDQKLLFFQPQSNNSVSHYFFHIKNNIQMKENKQETGTEKTISHDSSYASQHSSQKHHHTTRHERHQRHKKHHIIQINRVKTVLEQIAIISMAIYVLWSDSLVEMVNKKIFDLAIENGFLIHEYLTYDHLHDGLFLVIFCGMFMKGILRQFVMGVYIVLIGYDIMTNQHYQWWEVLPIVLYISNLLFNHPSKLINQQQEHSKDDDHKKEKIA